jgi:hypothetical protein
MNIKYIQKYMQIECINGSNFPPEGVRRTTDGQFHFLEF